MVQIHTHTQLYRLSMQHIQVQNHSMQSHSYTQASNVGIRPAHRCLCHQPCLLQLQLWRGPLRWSWLLGLHGTNTYKYTIMQTVNATHSGAKPFNAESLIYTGIKCRHQTGSSSLLRVVALALPFALLLTVACAFALTASLAKVVLTLESRPSEYE